MNQSNLIGGACAYQPTVITLELAMTSLEIAELVESRHDNVKRTIESLVSKGVIAFPQTEEKPTAGRPVSYYVFQGEKGKRDSIIVVAQLSPEFTARLVDRWRELEGKGRTPQTFSEALRLAADLEDEKQRLKSQLAVAAPKVEFVDRYVEATGSQTFRQVCKLLKAKEPDFRLFLYEKHIMYRLSGTFTPYQQHIDAGRFEVKTGTNQINNHAFTQSRFTAKGIKWIAGLWAEHLAKASAV